MGAMTKKLHSSRGVSMVIALVFFLACLMISGAILTAATANGVKSKDRTAQQQDYLAVSSAAELLKKELNGTTCSMTVIRHDDPVYTEVDGKQVQTNTNTYYESLPLEKSAENLLSQSMDAQCNPEGGQVSFSYLTGLNGTYTVDLSHSEFPTVSAVYTMSDKEASFVLSSGTYTQTVKFFAGTVNTTEDQAGNAVTAIVWSAGAIEKGDTVKGAAS